MQEVKYIVEKHGDLVKKINTKSPYLMDMIEEELEQINKEENSEKENNHNTIHISYRLVNTE